MVVMVMVVLAMTVVAVLFAWALVQSPLARAIGLSMACFAETARGEPDALR